jgi:alkylation response protein AidB-like acyl-CoA dehydrogenase
MQRFRFPADVPDEEETALRHEVRSFLIQQRESGGYTPCADCWVSGSDPAFSAKLGERGWLGMTWPKEYGGQGRSALHRLVVTEELLAAAAPVGAHWVADRQTGAQILRYGTEQQKREILPAMAAGTSFAAIGMSEPQAGSDLAAVITRAEQDSNGDWIMNGRKIWSTGAHISDYMIVLARTSPAEGRNRQVGLSQFLVPLKTPGIEVTGIRDLTGSVHFNETLFDNVRLSADTLLGTEGNGWAQCMGELATERSGPERFLTTFVILEQTLAQLRDKLDEQGLIIAGRLLAHLTSLRCMSRGIARLIQSGDSPDTEAALVKQMGNALERNILDDMRRLLATVPQPPTELATLITDATLRLPSHTLRGGTTEILRGIIARQLGLR